MVIRSYVYTVVDITITDFVGNSIIEINSGLKEET